jgi:hypothetical protein
MSKLSDMMSMTEVRTTVIPLCICEFLMARTMITPLYMCEFLMTCVIWSMYKKTVKFIDLIVKRNLYGKKIVLLVRHKLSFLIEYHVSIFRFVVSIFNYHVSIFRFVDEIYWKILTSALVKETRDNTIILNFV